MGSGLNTKLFCEVFVLDIKKSSAMGEGFGRLVSLNTLPKQMMEPSVFYPDSLPISI
jgi:hypothetical protein